MFLNSVNTKNHHFDLNWGGSKEGGECGLHPSIHTLLKFNLAQDVVVCPRFSGLGNDPSQAGHTLSSSFTLTVSLHLGHLTGWSLTRLISVGDLFLRVFFRLFFSVGFLAVERN
jgi:hypothetical protein